MGGACSSISSDPMLYRPTSAIMRLNEIMQPGVIGQVCLTELPTVPTCLIDRLITHAVSADAISKPLFLIYVLSLSYNINSNFSFCGFDGEIRQRTARKFDVYKYTQQDTRVYIKIYTAFIQFSFSFIPISVHKAPIHTLTRIVQ